MTVENWSSMKEVSERLGASNDTVVYWIKHCNLPAVKIGRLWRFKMSEVERWQTSDDALKTKAWKNARSDQTFPTKGESLMSYKPLFKLLIDKEMKKKDLAEKAGISIATITKMGKLGSHVNTDVLEKICLALGCKIGDIVEIVQVGDGQTEDMALAEDEYFELDSAACEEYGLTETEQDIVHFIYEQLQYYRDNPPSFMINQVRSDLGIGSYEEAKRSIPTDRFYSLVFNEVIENWGQEGCDFNQKHIPFKLIESGYFEAEEQAFGEMKIE